MNVAKGTKRGSRRGQKQNWLKFSTVSSRVAGCQQRNSDWGGVKVIIPSRCPGVSALSLGVGGVPYTSYSQVMENISPSFTRPSCVLTAAATTGKPQPSEERHSLGSGRGGRLCRLAQNDQYKAPLAKESASLFPSVFNQSRYSGERIITSSMRGAGRTKTQRQGSLPRPHPSSSSSRDGALTCVQNAFERPYRGQFGFAAGEVNVMHQ